MSEEIPSWLLPVPEVNRNKSSNVRLKSKVNDIQFEITFDHILDKICDGISLRDIFEEDKRGLTVKDFLRWVRKDETRKEKFNEALEINAEVITSEIKDIADAVGSLEDVQRSTLRINARKHLASVYYRKKYGDVKQVQHSGQISVLQALRDAESRLIEADYEMVETTDE